MNKKKDEEEGTYKDNNKVTRLIFDPNNMKTGVDWIICCCYISPLYLWHLCGSKFLLLPLYLGHEPRLRQTIPMILPINTDTHIQHFPRCYLCAPPVNKCEYVWMSSNKNQKHKALCYRFIYGKWAVKLFIWSLYFCSVHCTGMDSV